MPANMMNAAVGSSVYVIGSSRATVIAGPMPGSTPTAVPRVTPTSAYSRYRGCRAVAKPSSSAPMSPTEHPQPAEDPGRQRDAEPGDEHGLDDETEGETDQRRAPPRGAERPCHPGEEHRRRERPPQHVDHRDVDGERRHDLREGHPVG